MPTRAAPRWFVNRTNPEFVSYLSRRASVSPIFAQVAINRGLKTPEDIALFLNPALDQLQDPFLLPDLARALQRIKEAKKRSERVLVHGDYDADGVTATAIMVETLKRYGIDVPYFIPNRLQHGYGFGMQGLQKAKEAGAGLIITVDCGITSFETVAAARSIGIDVIITDHHEPLQKGHAGRPEEGDPAAPSPYRECVLPDALAVVNPKCSDTPLSILSGAGVAFTLARGLFDNKVDDVYDLLDLAALGTAADVVPLMGENRVIVKEGMGLIRSGQRAGVRILKEVANVRSEALKALSLSYSLVPRINAAGRVADATEVVKLLTTLSEAEAEPLARWLNEMNSKRQEIEEHVYSEAVGLLEEGSDIDAAVVLAGKGWHPGVVGIVASRIAEAYYRPTFILTEEDGFATGSGRSIPSFDLYGGLTECADILTRFGGHRQAVGLCLSLSGLDAFRKRISALVTERLTPEERAPVLHMDAAVKLSEVTTGLVDELVKLEPLGCGNEEPIFGMRGLTVAQSRIVGNNHLKLFLRQNGRSIDAIGFNLGGFLDESKDSSLVDVAFTPTINEWDGARYLQLTLKALRPSIPEQ